MAVPNLCLGHQDTKELVVIEGGGNQTVLDSVSGQAMTLRVCPMDTLGNRIVRHSP